MNAELLLDRCDYCDVTPGKLHKKTCLLSGRHMTVRFDPRNEHRTERKIEMTPEKVLLIVGATIFGILGSIHLLYTFFTNKFDAFDQTVTKAMRETSPVLTKETTMWDAWIGFNVSHSLGAMLVTAFYVPLALTNEPHVPSGRLVKRTIVQVSSTGAVVPGFVPRGERKGFPVAQEGIMPVQENG